jgi:hypothetical protein
VTFLMFITEGSPSAVERGLAAKIAARARKG